MGREPASRALDRYELAHAAEQRFDSLSGGQQARFQILLLELSGATMLLLDEPTDNLDIVSAEALEDGLAAFDGTVLAVTHDRWFARGFDRFLVFGADGGVYESDEPVWDEGRVERPLPRAAAQLPATGSDLGFLWGSPSGGLRLGFGRISSPSARPPCRVAPESPPPDWPLGAAAAGLCSGSPGSAAPPRRHGVDPDGLADETNSVATPSGTRRARGPT